MTIAAGKLTERVTIQECAKVQDSVTGEEAESWQSIALGTVWAQVIQQSGMEAVVDARETAKHRIAARIRHRSDVTTAMRIVWRSRQYEIRSIDEMPTIGELVINGEEIETRV